MSIGRVLIVTMVALSSSFVLGATLRVSPHQKIQDIVAQSKPGDVIEVEPGLYREAVYVDKENITIRGIVKDGQWARLDGEHKLNDGIIASAPGFRIENMYVSHYKGNGIMTQGADHVVIRGNIVDHTGIYGIYPTLGQNVVVESNVVFGIADAGIYVGSCNHIEVNRNEVYENVAGIEIENSENALVKNNLVYNNTGGILAFALPGLPHKKTENVIIRDNFVLDNNHRNFGAAGSVVANIPPGSGIILLAADKVTIEGNVIRDNAVAGVVVADLSIMPGMAKDPEVDPNPDHVKIFTNVMQSNGTKSIKSLFNWYYYVGRSLVTGNIPEGATADILPPGADIYATGRGQGNCVTSRLSFKTIGTSLFGKCPLGDEEATPTSMLIAREAVQTNKTKDLGMATYGAVCSGCHALDMVRIGPAVREIREKYAGNPAGIVTFATKPHKVRPAFPEMPPQAYLGPQKLEAVARYMLGSALAH